MKINKKPTHEFRPLCSKCGGVASTIQLFKDSGKWRLVYEGSDAGSGGPPGDKISPEAARAIIIGFTQPYTKQGVRAADFYDDGGFCLECSQFYCPTHWNISTTGGGICPKGHFKSLDPHWSPDCYRVKDHVPEYLQYSTGKWIADASVMDAITGYDGDAGTHEITLEKAQQIVKNLGDNVSIEWLPTSDTEKASIVGNEALAEAALQGVGRVPIPGDPADECLDCIVGMPPLIERMRDSNDSNGLPRLIVKNTDSAFNDLDRSGESANGVAFFAMDALYQSISELAVVDAFAVQYVATVVKNFFHNLSNRNCLTYYILDIEMDDDSLRYLETLLMYAGVAVVCSRSDSDNWDTLARRIRDAIKRNEHVVYIETNAAVNYIERALELADEFECVTTFRNQTPEEHAPFKVIKLPQS